MSRVDRRGLLTAILGLLSALIIGGVIAAVLGEPAIDGYRALLRYSVGTRAKTGVTLSNAVPLVLTGLSAAIAFASGAVNLGQPGQVLIGALASTYVGLHVHVASALLVPLLLSVGAGAGALWSGVAALTKRRFGMNEFITTLMLNELARLFTDWAISSPLQDPAAGSVTTRAIDRRGFLPMLTTTLSSSVVLALAMVAVSILVFRRSVAGYEWRMVGQAPLFARLGGVDTDRSIAAVMLSTGALAGLAGSVLLMAGPHKFTKGLGGNYGWDGVMIAVVAANALLGVLLYGLLFSALQTGAIGMQIRTDIPPEFVQILQAVIVLVTVAGRGLAGSVWAGWSARRAAKRIAARAPG